MPLNPSQGLGKHESLLQRSVIALSFLILGVWSLATMVPLLPPEQFLEILEEGRISWGQGISILVMKRLFHIPFLDGMLQRTTLVRVPAALNINPASSYQAFTLFVDSGAIYAIMLIEEIRRANTWKPASVPFISDLLSTRYWRLLPNLLLPSLRPHAHRLIRRLIQASHQPCLATRITEGTLAALSGVIWLYILISGSLAGL